MTFYLKLLHKLYIPRKHADKIEYAPANALSAALARAKNEAFAFAICASPLTKSPISEYIEHKFDVFLSLAREFYDEVYTCLKEII